MSRTLTFPIAGLWLAMLSHASAGMTVITLSDMARLRLDALSFFLFLYFLCSWLVKISWNQLAGAFPAMPALHYRRALALVFVTGLLFYVVLTMISGARELLTPGAWEKQGVGYRERENLAPLGKSERRESLVRLRDSIWAHAEANGGAAPESPFAAGVSNEPWKYPGGGYYGMLPDVKPGAGREILAYEPAAAGSRRFILLSDGSIEDRAEGTLKRQIEEESKR